LKASPGVRLLWHQAFFSWTPRSCLSLPGIRALVTALDGQVLTAAPGRSLRKRALSSTPLQRKQINLTPSQQPKSFLVGQRFSSSDTLTSQVSYYLLRAVASFPAPINPVPPSILPLDPHGPTSPRHCPHLALGCIVAVFPEGHKSLPPLSGQPDRTSFVGERGRWLWVEHLGSDTEERTKVEIRASAI